MSKYDHRKYQGSPTGRIPSQPEVQDLVHGKIKPGQKIVETDFSAVENRLMALYGIKP